MTKYRQGHKVRKLLPISNYRLTLVTNYTCNNRCSFCYARTSKFKPDSVMSQEVFEKCLALIKANKIKNIRLIGGEPTVHPNFFQYLNTLSENGAKTVLITNGRKLKNKKFLQKVYDTKIEQLSISFQTPGPKESKILQGEEQAYFDAVQALKNLRQYQGKIKIGLMIVLGTVDLDFYTRVFKKIKELGYIRIAIAPNNSSISCAGEGIIKHDDLAKYYLQLREVLDKISLKRKFLSKMPLCLFSEKVLKKMFDDKEISSTCNVIRGQEITIQPDGSIIPCTYWIRKQIGHINEFFDKDSFSQRRFIQVWERGHFRNFRRKAFVYRSKKCQKCKLFPQKCVGGCMLSYIGKDKKYIDRMIPGWEKNSIFYKND